MKENVSAAEITGVELTADQPGELRPLIDVFFQFPLTRVSL
jgi:hypothetical protein